MNWLAHILLSKRHVEYQLGNILADPFKGRLWPNASNHLRDGVEMHQAIDIFTDTHPWFARSKSRLGERGYLKAVVLDLLFDHFLSNHWNHYCTIGLPRFIKQFYQQAHNVAQQYPSEHRRFINNVIDANLLLSYQDFDGFVRALDRIDGRLSARVKRKDSASRYVSIVEQNYLHLEEDFEQFFPELMTFFKSHDLGDSTDHYLTEYH